MKSNSQHGADGKVAASQANDEGAVESAPAEAATATCDATDSQSKIASLEDSLLRARADLQNVQRRAATEKTEAIRYANAELMKSLLNVIDDFDRTVAAAETTKDSLSILNGIKLVHANLMKALRDFGLETIEAKDRKFDPTVHEALMQQPSKDVEPGTVLEQVAGGYKLRDRVLRPARVVVAARSEDETS
jgi:molecular chaperone GrpE